MRKYFEIIPSWLAHNLILIRTIPNDAAASDEDDDGDDVDDVADFSAVFLIGICHGTQLTNPSHKSQLSRAINY